MSSKIVSPASRRAGHAIACISAWLAISIAHAAETAVIELEVDTRDVQHGIQHAHLTLPAKSGEMSVVYPKWIQGEHGPTGPIEQVTGLKFTAGDQTLAWTRDPIDAFRFRVTVPDGIAKIEADFDYLSPAASYGPGGFPAIPLT